MAGHSPEQARAAAAVVANAIHEARQIVDGEFAIPFRGITEPAAMAGAA